MFVLSVVFRQHGLNFCLVVSSLLGDNDANDWLSCRLCHLDGLLIEPVQLFKDPALAEAQLVHELCKDEWIAL